MSKVRDNHYVPQWYQRGFLDDSNRFHYLDLNPEVVRLPDGREFRKNSRSRRPTSQCFYQTDLYTTFFGAVIVDEIERRLFGAIDDAGARAVRAFIADGPAGWHRHFSDFFSYLDSQKTRTPKGLDWIRTHYTNLSQLSLMREMQALGNMHCTIWSEGVREIVSAANSSVKFIVTDHPVTVYNYGIPLTEEVCVYPNEPSIALKGTQTLFPLDSNNCLVLTNLEYAEDPELTDPKEKRANPRFFRFTMARTDAFIRTRSLTDEEVEKINLILKMRARRYVAAPNESWLHPEERVDANWQDLRHVLLPPSEELHRFSGEMYVGYNDGSTYYQDALGRTSPPSDHLEKPARQGKIRRNDPCGCGSGRKYKRCCLNKDESERTSWSVMSIRERNLALCNGVADILGLNRGKTWEDVRRELSNDQVRRIHELYGFLWPLDTDLLELLPKPDGALRALYTGIIDPRVLPRFAIGMIPYFEEVLIQQPFINPLAVKPEFSPIESPHQYKQQTLKDALLLLTLMPFIELGIVNFIPDPCLLDQHLHRQMLNMAEQRKGTLELDEDEEELLKELSKQDFVRTIRMLPEAYQRRQIAEAMPDLSDQETEDVLDYMKWQIDNDPLSLLQEGVFDKNGGQLTMLSMAPNFELSFYIAQVTGSLLLTDSPHRWKEIQGAQHSVQRKASYPWEDLTAQIGELQFPVNLIPEETLKLHMAGDFGGIRAALGRIYSAILGDETELPASRREALKRQFLAAHQKMVNHRNDTDRYCFLGQMKSVAPAGGFVHHHAQRLLVSSGSDGHLDRVAMAIFAQSVDVGLT